MIKTNQPPQNPGWFNNIFWFKLNGLLRYTLIHTSTRFLPLYVVNEFPKSGGSWVGEMLSEALGVPFPRNRFPIFAPSILHGHFIQSWNMHNVLVVWRDGRDVLVSQYFHYFFHNDRGNARLVDQCRADLRFSDYNAVQDNLIPFMEYVFERKRHPRFSWADFVNAWEGFDGFVYVRYEDLRSNPVDELQRIITELSGQTLSHDRTVSIVNNHSFERLSGRKAGEENANSRMRKGVVGDWKNYFDRRSSKLFHEYAGDALIRLGYEPNHAWTER